MNRAMSLLVLASLSLAAAACATATPAVTDWNFPNLPPPDDTPRLSRAEKLTNPPHPSIYYEDYMMEPTRFEFRPRNLIIDETDPNANADAGGGDMAAADGG